MDMKRKVHVAITAGAGLASVLCILGSRLFFADIRESNATVKWPSTEGRVLRSQALNKGCDDSFDYRPDILYTYRVDGEEFRSTRLHVHHAYCGRLEEVRAFLRKYQGGARVTVFYDPQRPERAVFFTEKAAWFMYVFVTLVLVVGAVFGLAAIAGILGMVVKVDVSAKVQASRTPGAGE
jgi:hypothetical protein